MNRVQKLLLITGGLALFTVAASIAIVTSLLGAITLPLFAAFNNKKPAAKPDTHNTIDAEFQRLPTENDSTE